MIELTVAFRKKLERYVKERTAELTGGSFSIVSTPGQETIIRAFRPIEAEDQPQKGVITQKPAISNFSPVQSQSCFPEEVVQLSL